MKFLLVRSACPHCEWDALELIQANALNEWLSVGHTFICSECGRRWETQPNSPKVLKLGKVEVNYGEAR